MIDDGFSLGYNGWAAIALQDSHYFVYEQEGVIDSIGGSLVQVTSASVSKNRNTPQMQGYYTPHDAATAVGTFDESEFFFESNSESESGSNSSVYGPIRCGYGLFTFSGQISFELTRGTLEFLFNEVLFKRDTLFSVQFYDGKKTCTVYNCAWTSISIQGSANSMVNTDISFQTNNGFSENLVIHNMDAREGQMYEDTDFFIPYWQTGSPGIEEFTLSLNRDVSAIFLNNEFNTATYLRPGTIEASFQATIPQYILDTGNEQLNLEEGQLTIMVGSKHLILNNKVLNSSTYNMSNMTSIGKKVYSWGSLRDTPTEKLFSIIDSNWNYQDKKQQ